MSTFSEIRRQPQMDRSEMSTLTKVTAGVKLMCFVKAFTTGGHTVDSHQHIGGGVDVVFVEIRVK